MLSPEDIKTRYMPCFLFEATFINKKILLGVGGYWVYFLDNYY